MKKFILSLPLVEQKLFYTGVCSDLCEHIGRILTEEQKQSVINMVDECYPESEQAEILNKYCDEMNRQVNESIDRDILGHAE